MSPVPTDLLLVRCRVPAPDDLREAALRFRAASGLQLELQRASWSPETGWAYVYFVHHAAVLLDASVPPRLATAWTGACDCSEADVSRLELLHHLTGRSHGGAAARHYVVETDPEAGWDDELARWYEQEHMPGLAAVPGCVDARRFRNHDGGPGSHACYSLLTEEALGSPPWLAVRGTEWSGRVRPHFRNTRRTLMHIVA